MEIKLKNLKASRQTQTFLHFLSRLLPAGVRRRGPRLHPYRGPAAEDRHASSSCQESAIITSTPRPPEPLSALHTPPLMCSGGICLQGGAEGRGIKAGVRRGSWYGDQYWSGVFEVLRLMPPPNMNTAGWRGSKPPSWFPVDGIKDSAFRIRAYESENIQSCFILSCLTWKSWNVSVLFNCSKLFL